MQLAAPKNKFVSSAKGTRKNNTKAAGRNPTPPAGLDSMSGAPGLSQLEAGISMRDSDSDLARRGAWQ